MYWCTFFSSLLTRSTAPHLHTTPDIYLKDYCNVESSDELYRVSSRQILVHKIYWDSINQLPSWIFHSNNISWWPFNENIKSYLSALFWKILQELILRWEQTLRSAEEANKNNKYIFAQLYEVLAQPSPPQHRLPADNSTSKYEYLKF